MDFISFFKLLPIFYLATGEIFSIKVYRLTIWSGSIILNFNKLTMILDLCSISNIFTGSLALLNNPIKLLIIDFLISWWLFKMVSISVLQSYAWKLFNIVERHNKLCRLFELTRFFMSFQGIAPFPIYNSILINALLSADSFFSGNFCKILHDSLLSYY